MRPSAGRKTFFTSTLLANPPEKTFAFLDPIVQESESLDRNIWNLICFFGSYLSPKCYIQTGPSIGGQCQGCGSVQMCYYLIINININYQLGWTPRPFLCSGIGSCTTKLDFQSPTTSPLSTEFLKMYSKYFEIVRLVSKWTLRCNPSGPSDLFCLILSTLPLL